MLEFYLAFSDNDQALCSSIESGSSMAASVTVTMPMPDDWHVHLRDNSDLPLLSTLAPFSGTQFYNNLLMPNLASPLKDFRDIGDYRDQVLGNVRELRSHSTYMTMYLTNRTTPKMVVAASNSVMAAKYYPDSGTTNSSSGLHTPQDLHPRLLATMEDMGIVLCLHAELTKRDQPDILLREQGFIPHLEWLVDSYPALKIVVEHISDRRMLQAVLDLPDTVAATITAHHPLITQADVVSDPHCLCMPIAKTAEDRDALAKIILQAADIPKIFFGSDSAPHSRTHKDAGAAGIWTSPVAIPILWEHFTAGLPMHLAIAAFEAFMCFNGARFYGLGQTDQTPTPFTQRPAINGSLLNCRPTIKLKDEEWVVPKCWPIGDHSKIDFRDSDRVLVPWRAGEILSWRIEGMSWFGRSVEA